MPASHPADQRPSSRRRSLHDAFDQYRTLGLVEIEDLHIVRKLFQHAVGDAFAETIPDHDITQRLTLEVRCTGRIDDHNQVGGGCQVVDCSTHFFDALLDELRLTGIRVVLPLAEQFLSIGVVRLVREHG